MTDSPAVPPRPLRRPERHERFGLVLEDEYAWMRSARWQEVMRDPATLEPEIRAHLEAENAWTEAVLAPLADLRKTLVAELRGRIEDEDASVPEPDGPFEYYRRFAAGAQYPVFCRRPRGGGGETVLVDGPVEAAGKPYFRVANSRHSPDHRLVAWTVDRSGGEYFTLLIRDAATGAALDAPIEYTKGDFAWAGTHSLYYTVLDDNHRPYRVMRHRLGSDPASDTVVYEEPDPSFYLGVGETEDRRHIVIASHDHSQTAEARLLDAADPDAAPLLIAPRESGVDYDVTVIGDRLIVRTNWPNALDYHLCTAPLATPERAHWREMVPHVPGRLIRGMIAFAGHLARLEREDGLPRIVVRALGDSTEHAIVFDEAAYDLTLVPGWEFAGTTLRFSYSSPATPLEVFDYDMASRARLLRKQQKVPSGHDPARYVVERLHATGHDGAQIPVTVLRGRDMPVKGHAPLLLYGYGAYGISIPASFAPNRFSLVDRGFVYAIAHIRGGTDKGIGWYLDGKLEKKENTFRDFVAVADHLVAAGYTAAGRIVAHGGSAGGMLMGAVANMRPELFAGIVAEVPFVDVLNTMCDASLPLTPPEWVEWGNPLEDEAAFHRLRRYSPYDNVVDRPYPDVLVTSGVSDPRVTYWEPAKWVARLRARNTAATRIALYMNMGAGHGGAAGRFDRLDEVTLVYAFVLDVCGRAHA
ncbi:MAG: S9 family peptidase [Alphaproteobacteria bacterium]|nr:S9 family peptidase [Alphaproteobacteria bacterium]